MLEITLGQEDPLEKEMATHSSILVWRILWTKELGRLQSMVSLLTDLLLGVCPGLCASA